jgi:heme exporter protein B
MTIKLSKNALDGLDRSVSYHEILTLAAVDGIIITLGIILFPYVWKS